MNRHQIVQYLQDKGIIAIIRADGGGDDLVRAVEAVAEGGVHCIEVTMTTPDALRVIEMAAKKLAGADVLLGVGSVLDAETARLAILAGAQYVVAPITDVATIQMAHRYGKPALPGAFTPNEIFRAWEAGGDLVKVFPATLGGLDYIKAVKAPMPDIPLVPTGGVDADNLHTFVTAGVAAVGVGSALVSSALLKARNFKGITENAHRFSEALDAARRM